MKSFICLRLQGSITKPIPTSLSLKLARHNPLFHSAPAPRKRPPMPKHAKAMLQNPEPLSAPFHDESRSFAIILNDSSKPLGALSVESE